MRAAVIAAALLLLSACGSYELVPAGKVEIDGKVAFVTETDWNGRAEEDGYTMTQDGPGLQLVFFHVAVEDGETLFEDLDVESRHDIVRVIADMRPDTMGYRFRRTMTEPEIMDLFVSSYSVLFKATVEADGLSPATLGGKPGFRFTYIMTPADGVPRRGLAVGAVVDKELYVVSYFGTTAFHFEKHRADVEKLIASLSFVTPAAAGAPSP